MAESQLSGETALTLIGYIARHCTVELPLDFLDTPPPEQVELAKLEDRYVIIVKETE